MHYLGADIIRMHSSIYNNSTNIRIVATDLDGTLLSSQGLVLPTDSDTLAKLGELNVIRVVATGRSPYSFSKVIPNDFPIDYLIFSSGAGAMDWRTKEIIYTTQIAASKVQAIVDTLILHRADFMVHEPIPANHRFLYYQCNAHNADFNRRVEIYAQFCQPLVSGLPYPSDASQVIAVLPSCVERFEMLKPRFPDFKVIRATSPLDGQSIWMEIFNKSVSKAYGIDFICRKYGVDNHEVITLGNDFNDLDMLSHYKKSFVVSNAPNELKELYPTVSSNNHSGFSELVGIFFPTQKTTI